jgi:hypothetical protein
MQSSIEPQLPFTPLTGCGKSLDLGQKQTQCTFPLPCPTSDLPPSYQKDKAARERMDLTDSKKKTADDKFSIRTRKYLGEIRYLPVRIPYRQLCYAAMLVRLLWAYIPLTLPHHIPKRSDVTVAKDRTFIRSSHCVLPRLHRRALVSPLLVQRERLVRPSFSKKRGPRWVFAYLATPIPRVKLGIRAAQ